MEAGAVLYAGGGSKGSSSDLALSGVSGKNAQTKSRQCRGKEEESDTACCIGTPEHCGLIRRDLVVCPPFWLLPRIETGDSFLWACGAPLLRPHPQGNVPAWAFAGRTFRRLWGMSVPFSLSAPLLCQTIVAILCGNFEQFANKRPHGWMPQCKNRPGFLLWKPGRFVCFICAFSSAHAITCGDF